MAIWTVKQALWQPVGQRFNWSGNESKFSKRSPKQAFIRHLTGRLIEELFRRERKNRTESYKPQNLVVV